MRSSVWVSLIRIFPPEVQEKLMAVMTSGNEINISGVLRFEQDFLVVRGRLAGTTDDPGVVFVPYDRIDYIGFRIPMKDTDVEAMFVNSNYQTPPPEVEMPVAYAPAPAPAPSLAPVTRVMPAPAATPRPPTPAPAPAAAPPKPAAPEPAPEPIAPPPVPAAAPAAAAAAGSAILPGKAALLERLRRSRLNQEGPKSSEGR
jgi:hypothetical protein